MKTDLRIFPDPEALAAAAADRLVQAASEVLERREHFNLALAGGSTPRRLYELLATEPWRSAFPWEATHFFWGDERSVPPDHPQSNFRMAWEALLAHVPLPAENIHRIPAELPPQEAAAAYAAELERHWNGRPSVFDLILLGLGPDGHTASLFPGTEALQINDQPVAAVYVPQMATWRITLTLPVISAAHEALFLVSGVAKAEILAAVLHGPPGRYPAQAIRPRGILRWYVDAAAAAHLPQTGA